MRIAPTATTIVKDAGKEFDFGAEMPIEQHTCLYGIDAKKPWSIYVNRAVMDLQTVAEFKGQHEQ